uniref:Uncharacterized protein n=1 Tax=Cacopsylla melanoneura TaxID=428564 RepID=A0A8D9DQ67_9HEMI
MRVGVTVSHLGTCFPLGYLPVFTTFLLGHCDVCLSFYIILIFQMQHLKSISQQLRLMDVPKAKPMSVALKYYVEKWLNDRDADLSEIISTTESIKRLRGDKNKKNKKPRKFYNLAFDQRKHKMDEVLD